MTELAADKLRGFGPEVVQLLIPHRHPFLMVDAVDSYSTSPEWMLHSFRHISANESVFEGHFPAWKVWPGVYTIEGMGQSCMLLAVLSAIYRYCEAADEDPFEALTALENLDHGYRLRPGFRPSLADRVLERLSRRRSPMGMASSVDVKLLHPVFAGQRLDFVVRRTRVVGEVQRFDVEASVEGRPVALGTLGSSSVSLPFDSTS